MCADVEGTIGEGDGRVIDRMQPIPRHPEQRDATCASDQGMRYGAQVDHGDVWSRAQIKPPVTGGKRAIVWQYAVPEGAVPAYAAHVY